MDDLITKMELFASKITDKDTLEEYMQIYTQVKLLMLQNDAKSDLIKELDDKLTTHLLTSV